MLVYMQPESFLSVQHKLDLEGSSKQVLVLEELL